MTDRRITSRDNPLLRELRLLSEDPRVARSRGQVWIEGEHLCEAAYRRGRRASQAVVAQSAWDDPSIRHLARYASERVVLPDALFARLSPLPSPAGLALVIDIERDPSPDHGAPALVLDRLQDPGNVGSILRSAAAFGVGQVWALRGTAWLWSPKVLRGGMGAHFSLRLVEGLTPEDLDRCTLPIVATSSHARDDVTQVRLPSPCHWVFGQEGQGVAAEVAHRCALMVRIPQPGGEESLNVAAAAAVCLYESRRQAPV